MRLHLGRFDILISPARASKAYQQTMVWDLKP
jgi:hypothetical protein